MILVASQRGGAKQLGAHLMRTDENEHVEIHEVRGFVSDDVTGALKEAQAASVGTKCKQYLFSVSLNPPETERVEVGAFEEALSRIEKANGLEGQPRAIVFHEKEGRRHCHAVWSRIDAETMTAKPLPYFKNKMRELARELYLEHGWKMPTGLMNYGEANPRNYSLAEWQQAKHLKLDASELKQLFQDCWAISDSRASFKAAIEERGFKLAKGDRRGFVAVSHEGEVLSVGRYIGKKAKDVAERLGEPDDLPSVDQAKVQIASELNPVVQSYLADLKAQRHRDAQPLLAAKRRMTEHHRTQRKTIAEAQAKRRGAEDASRKSRLRRGVLGLWDRLTGKRRATLARNEQEAMAGFRRDQMERDQLKAQQLAQRRILQTKMKSVRERHQRAGLEVRAELSRLAQLKTAPDASLSERFNAPRPMTRQPAPKPRKPRGPDYEM